MTQKLQIGVLVSGSGSNLQALIDACRSPGFPARIAVVISNLPSAYALERARAAGLETYVLEHRAYPERGEYDAALAAALTTRGVQAVCLAGFMRLLGSRFLRAFPGQVLNVHPALLPAFPGLHGPRQALAHGVKLAGATVHFVDEGTDTGPIIVQAAVPVLPTDDEAALAARILEQEHRIYPLALRWLAEGRIRVDGRTVTIDAAPAIEGLALRNPGN